MDLIAENSKNRIMKTLPETFRSLASARAATKDAYREGETLPYGLAYRIKPNCYAVGFFATQIDRVTKERFTNGDTFRIDRNLQN